MYAYVVTLDEYQSRQTKEAVENLVRKGTVSNKDVRLIESGNVQQEDCKHKQDLRNGSANLKIFSPMPTKHRPADARNHLTL